MIKRFFTDTCLILATILLLGIPALAKGAKPVLLRLHLKPGQTYKQGVVMKTTTTRKNEDMNISTTTRLGFGLGHHVLDVESDGTARTKITFNMVIVHMDLQMNGETIKKIDYNSQNPPSEVPDRMQIFAGMVGQSITSTISPRGKLIKVEGMKQLIAHAAAGISDPEKRQAAMDSMDSHAGDTPGSAPGHFELPQQAVNEGDSWTKEFTEGTKKALLFDATYTVKMIRQGTVEVGLHADMSVAPGSAGANDDSGVSATHDISGFMDGELHIDQQTGLNRYARVAEHKRDNITMMVPETTVDGVTKPASTESYVSTQDSLVISWIDAPPK